MKHSSHSSSNCSSSTSTQKRYCLASGSGPIWCEWRVLPFLHNWNPWARRWLRGCGVIRYRKCPRQKKERRKDRRKSKHHQIGRCKPAEGAVYGKASAPIQILQGKREASLAASPRISELDFVVVQAVWWIGQSRHQGGGLASRQIFFDWNVSSFLISCHCRYHVVRQVEAGSRYEVGRKASKWHTIDIRPWIQPRNNTQTQRPNCSSDSCALPDPRTRCCSRRTWATMLASSSACTLCKSESASVKQLKVWRLRQAAQRQTQT